jgi:3-hydroxyisobutyrate dehydrogenase
MAKIAFIGIGVMGRAMARHLVDKGHALTVYNRTREKAEIWSEANGGKVASTPAEAAIDADAVITCVGNDNDLTDVILGENGALRVMQPNSLLIDHTTVSAHIAEHIYSQASARCIQSIDAPITGGQAGAENGSLTIMCGGEANAVALATPIMEAYSQKIVHVGSAGSGQRSKMVNQICIAGILQGLSEGIRFAQAAQLDVDKVFEAVSGGAASSWQMLNRWPTMVKDEFDFGFAIDWMRKDLGLAMAEAKENGSTLPLTALVDQFYAEVQAMGGSRQDTSALIRRIRQST